MRHIDPALDYSFWQDALERKEAAAFYELSIDDILSEPIEVDGATYDLKVKAWFTRDGAHGDIEIHSIDFGDIYLYIHEMPDSHVMLNQDSFKTRQRSTYDKIIKAATALAIKKASASNDWVMEDDE